MDINYKKFGTRVKIAREQKGLTQEQLAEKIDMTNNYISNIERNRSIPSISTLVRICNSLDVTPDYLLLDSIYESKEYIIDEIAKKLKYCNPKNLRLISGFISLLIDEQD